MPTDPTDAVAVLLKALHFAADKHRDQRRKDPDASPYINHPIALANILWVSGGIDDPNVICAALLARTASARSCCPKWSSTCAVSAPNSVRTGFGGSRVRNCCRS